MNPSEQLSTQVAKVVGQLQTLGALDGACLTEMFVAFYGDDKKSLVQAFVDSGRYVPVVGAVAQDIFRHEPPESALRYLARHGNGRAPEEGEHAGETLPTGAPTETTDYRPRARALLGAGEGG